MPLRNNYGDPNYWEKRYKDSTGDTFDWLQDWSTLKPLILRLVTTRDSHLLNLGCGNAAITQHMWDEGFHNIVNIDTSKEVITQMRKRNDTKRHGMKYLVMDVRKLQFEDESFDVVLDKSTIDALYCGDKAQKSVLEMLKEAKRVLKPNGFYLGLSYGVPKTRLATYQTSELGFFVSTHKLADFLFKQKLLPSNAKDTRNFEHYMYFCTKKEEVLKGLNNPKVQQRQKVDRDRDRDRDRERGEPVSPRKEKQVRGKAQKR